MKFKDYRDSLDGQEALNDIYQLINKKVINSFTVTGKIYSKSEIESFLSVDYLDFNDKAIVLLCKEKNYILLTNDRDFINADIDILTANSSF